jgi:hypothetical protein
MNIPVYECAEKGGAEILKVKENMEAYFLYSLDSLRKYCWLFGPAFPHSNSKAHNF